MARRPRINLAGYHHVINRGVNRCNIFLTDEDYAVFLRILDKACLDFNVIVHDYCLMSNHFHLMVETHVDNLSLFMKQVNGNYAIYFNKVSKRSGHLWQGRFYSRYVTSDVYFYTLIRYIEQNPIEAGMVERVGDYAYTLVSVIVNHGEILDAAKKSRLIEELSYENIQDIVGIKLSVEELNLLADIKAQKSRVKSLEEYFCSSENRQERNRAISLSVKDGYTHQEVSEYLDISKAMISKVIKSSQIGSDP